MIDSPSFVFNKTMQNPISEPLLPYMKPTHGKPTPRALKWINPEGAAGSLDEKQGFCSWSQEESSFVLSSEKGFFSGNCHRDLWKSTVIKCGRGMDSFPKRHKVGKPMYPSAVTCTTFDCLQSIFTTIIWHRKFILSKPFFRNSAVLENMRSSSPSKLKPLNWGFHQKMIDLMSG